MESIEVLNARLVDHFGVDSSTGRAMFRIVWANDETEKRLTRTTDNGVELLYPVVREVKKYTYLKDLYVLERLVIVPDENQAEMGGLKLSYEPLWAYRGPNDLPIPPLWEPTKFVIDCLHAALGKKSLARYVDTEENTTPEGREQRITKLAEELFGNESQTGDAMAHGEAIVVPNSYESQKVH